jgi:hypothetical protein
MKNKNNIILLGDFGSTKNLRFVFFVNEANDFFQVIKVFDIDFVLNFSQNGFGRFILLLIDFFRSYLKARPILCNKF